MATYSVMLQRFWRDFEADGNATPATAREVAEWAYRKGLWQPPRPYDPVAELAEDLAKAWREEYRTDKKGRRYRAKHAVKMRTGSTQFAFWADFDTAPHHHMERAFGQRRQQIADDCYHWKTDIDCYADKHPDRQPIQCVLDFTHDVEERQQLDRRDEDDEAA